MQTNISDTDCFSIGLNSLERMQFSEKKTIKFDSTLIMFAVMINKNFNLEHKSSILVAKEAQSGDWF